MNKNIKIIVFLVFAACLPGTADGQNPLTGGKEKEQNNGRGGRYPAFVEYVIETVAPAQLYFRNKITEITNRLEEAKSPQTFCLLFAAAFMLGLLHAAGPGHGKTFTSLYFLSDESSSIFKGIKMGSMIAFLQIISAIIFVAFAHFIFKHSYMGVFEDYHRGLKMISYAFITGIGMFLFIKTLKSIKREKKHEDSNDIPVRRSYIKYAVIMGVVPCPAAVIVLLYFLSIERFTLGIYISLFMAAGMAFTISAAGIGTIVVRKKSLKIFSRPGRIKNLNRVLSLGGAMMVFLLGAVLFMANCS